MSKDELIVYWAPSWGKPEEEDIDWNYLYNEPRSLLQDLKGQMNKNSKANNFLVCPAFRDLFKNTFVLSSTLGGDFEYDEIKNDFTPRREKYVGGRLMREPTVIARPHLRLSLGWAIFAEEPLIMEVTPPYFSSAKHMKYGVVAPGSFDCGNWFRSVNPEVILNEGETEFVLENNEPLIYIRFLTDKKVKLKRFYMDKELHQIEKACAFSPSVFRSHIPLAEKYDLFRRTKTNKKLIKLIQKNLVD